MFLTFVPNLMDVRKTDAAGLNRGIEEGMIPLEIG
jgi:hypothetical protein